MAAEGDFSTLPARVLDRTVNFLDIETLAACCCSCREWYEYLNANESIWEKACTNFGLTQSKDTYRRCWGTWKEYALIILKRLKEMRNSECFRESHFSIDMTAHGEIQSIYYYKDRLAVATDSRIKMLCTTSKTLLFDIVNTPGLPLFNVSVKFDHLHIMVEDTCDIIRRFDGSSRLAEAIYEGGNHELISFDFESRCGIVVGMYDYKIIQIWKLSSGNPLKRIMFESQDSCGKVKIVFIRSPSTNEKGLFYLLWLGLKRFFMWTFTFDDDISGDGIELCSDIVRRSDIYLPGWFLLTWNIEFISSLLNHNSLVYYSQPCASESCVINELDLNSVKISREIETKKVIKNLLAVGEKYIAFHTAGEDGVGEIIRVIEKTTSKLVATYKLPDDVYMYYTKNVEITFCDRNWLDGLDLTNDRGVLFAYVGKDEKVHFVEWIPRNEFAA